ncbi:hypothetical protein V6Z11_D11G169900 [Gossypium hirsutum]
MRLLGKEKPLLKVKEDGEGGQTFGFCRRGKQYLRVFNRSIFLHRCEGIDGHINMQYAKES